MENLKDILLVKETFIYFRKLVYFNLKESVFSTFSKSFTGKEFMWKNGRGQLELGKKTTLIIEKEFLQCWMLIYLDFGENITLK